MLRRLLRDCRQRQEDEKLIRLLRGAFRLSLGKGDLNRYREIVRRKPAFRLPEIERLTILAIETAKTSAKESYALFELVQAAAVGNCDLLTRSRVTVTLAEAAIRNGHYERAREACADAFEGLQILDGYFESSERQMRISMQGRIEHAWNILRLKVPTGDHPLDPANDIVKECAELIRWNSDSGSGQGLLAQSDATARLAIRMQRWVKHTEHKIAPTIQALQNRLRESARNSFVCARYLVTLADALVLIEQWRPAALIYGDVLRLKNIDLKHPIGIHAAVQEAYCCLTSENALHCADLLKRIDGESLKQLSELILTVAAETARYHAVDYRCRLESGKAVAADTLTTIRGLTRQVSILLSYPQDRLCYLRNLFYSRLVQDMDSILKTTVV